MPRYDAPKLLAIDPSGCRCTECLVGEYVPLDQATGDQALLLLTGKIADHTDETWTITRDERAGTVEASVGHRRFEFTAEEFPDHPAVDEDGRAVNDSAYLLHR